MGNYNDIGAWGGRAPGMAQDQTVVLAELQIPIPTSVVWCFDGFAGLDLTVDWGLGRTAFSKTLKSLPFSTGIVAADFLRLKARNTTGADLPIAALQQGWAVPTHATPTVLVSRPLVTAFGIGGGTVAATWRNQAWIYNPDAMARLVVQLDRGAGNDVVTLAALGTFHVRDYLGEITCNGPAVVTEA